MKRFFSAFGPLFAVALGAYLALGILLDGILLTVATAIAGQIYYMLPWLIMMTVFYIIIQLVFHTVRIRRDGEAKRLYLAELGSAPYDPFAERRALRKNRDFHAENIAYALIAILQSFITFGGTAILTVPVMVVVFCLYNRYLHLSTHQSWAKGRLRNAPDGDHNTQAH